MCWTTIILSKSATLLLLFLFLHQMTPLHVAAEKGRFKVVECLVKEGADINTKDNAGVGIFMTILLTVIILIEQ